MQSNWAESVIASAAAHGLTLATAESCTGGLCGACLTAVSGSSAVYRGGMITYCNEMKQQLLGVPAELLAEYGAVSPQCACSMADGARKRLCADLAVSVTGLAGPNGDGSGKPVGLVYLGLADASSVHAVELHLHGTREEIRAAAAEEALRLLHSAIARQNEKVTHK